MLAFFSRTVATCVIQFVQPHWETWLGSTTLTRGVT